MSNFYNNLIGQGTYGKVYEKIDITGRTAIKVSKFFDNTCAIMQELSVFTSRQKHNNIISHTNIYRDGGMVHIEMPYIEKNLHNLIKNLSDAQIKSIMLQIIKGISHLHHYGFIHQDITSSNILIDADYHVLIIDFGLSIFAGATLTTFMDEIQTMSYRAVEVLVEYGKYDRKIDIWSLGILWIEMLMRGHQFNNNIKYEQLVAYFEALGVPNNTSWPGVELCEPYTKIIEILKDKAKDEIKRLPPIDCLLSCHPNELAIIKRMLVMNPENRCDIDYLLKHSYFKQNTSTSTNIDPPLNNNIDKAIINNMIVHETCGEVLDVNLNYLLPYIFMRFNHEDDATVLLTAMTLLNRYLIGNKKHMHCKLDRHLAVFISISMSLDDRYGLVKDIYREFKKINKHLSKSHLDTLDVLEDMNFNVHCIVAAVYLKSIGADKKEYAMQIAMLMLVSLINQVYFKHSPFLLYDSCCVMVMRKKNLPWINTYAMKDINVVIADIERNIKLFPKIIEILSAERQTNLLELIK